MVKYTTNWRDGLTFFRSALILEFFVYDLFLGFDVDGFFFFLCVNRHGWARKGTSRPRRHHGTEPVLVISEQGQGKVIERAMTLHDSDRKGRLSEQY